MLAIKHGCYDTLEIHANRLVMFAIIAIIERQWSYLMKWKQEETTRATEHGHKHTHPPPKEKGGQDSRLKREWLRQKGRNDFWLHDNKEEWHQTPEENFFKKTTKTKI